MQQQWWPASGNHTCTHTCSAHRQHTWYVHPHTHTHTPLLISGKPTRRHHLWAFWTDVRLVARQPVWFLACAAYTLYVAVLGVYAYW